MNGLLSAGVGLLWVLVGVGVWLGWQLLRQNGRILLRLDELEKRLDELELGEPEEPAGLPIGSDAPEFELPDLTGARQRLAQYRGRPVLLIFFNPACGFCRDLGLKLAALHPGPEIRGRNSDADQSRSREAASAATVEPKLLLIISTGDAARNLEFFREHKVTGPVMLQKDMEVAAAYKTNGTPTGYLIDAEGKIASDLAIGAEALLALIDSPPRQRPFTPALSLSDAESEKPSQNADQRTTRFGNRSLAHSKIKRDGLKAGAPAPGFRLPRLDGGELSLDELRGRRVLLVFSDPHCGPCNSLLPELEKFHREHAEIGMVMISRGEPKENRAKVKEHGLSFPVVLQHRWEISRLYAMFATPMAYLIDEAGSTAAEVAVGTEPILSLMKNSPNAAALP